MGASPRFSKNELLDCIDEGYISPSVTHHPLQPVTDVHAHHHQASSLSASLRRISSYGQDDGFIRFADSAVMSPGLGSLDASRPVPFPLSMPAGLDGFLDDDSGSFEPFSHYIAVDVHLAGAGGPAPSALPLGSVAMPMALDASAAGMPLGEDLAFFSKVSRSSEYIDVAEPAQMVAMDIDLADDEDADEMDDAPDASGLQMDYAAALQFGGGMIRATSSQPTSLGLRHAAGLSARATMQPRSPAKGAVRSSLRLAHDWQPYPVATYMGDADGADGLESPSDDTLTMTPTTSSNSLAFSDDESNMDAAAAPRAPRSPSSSSSSSRRRGRRGAGPRGPSPASQNFRVEVNGFNISILVLRHQGHDGRHPTARNTFYYQARIRNVYPQKHLWAGWDTREGIEQRVTNLVLQYGQRLLKERPPALIKAAKRNAKLSRERRL